MYTVVLEDVFEFSNGSFVLVGEFLVEFDGLVRDQTVEIFLRGERVGQILIRSERFPSSRQFPKKRSLATTDGFEWDRAELAMRAYELRW